MTEQYIISDDGMLMPRLLISFKEKTFSFDDDLPSLPVPNLHETIGKYITSGNAVFFVRSII